MSAGTQEGRGEISMQAQHDASWDRLARAIGDIGERPRSLSAQTELSLAVTSLGSVTKTLLSRLVATGQERDTLAANLTSAIRAAERIATQHGETQAALTKAEQERDEAVKRAERAGNTAVNLNELLIASEARAAAMEAACKLARPDLVDAVRRIPDFPHIHAAKLARADLEAFDRILAQPGTGGAR